MRWWAFLAVAVGLSFGAKDSKTFIGVIHDNRCVGPNCATQCPITKGPTFTLQSGQDAWLLTGATGDQKTPAKYVGRKVIVTGTVAGHTLKVTSISPAR
jgi:hypothetical protein